MKITITLAIIYGFLIGLISNDAIHSRYNNMKATNDLKVAQQQYDKLKTDYSLVVAELVVVKQQRQILSAALASAPQQTFTLTNHITKVERADATTNDQQAVTISHLLDTINK